MGRGVPGAPGGAVKPVLPLERFAISGLGCSPGRHRVPEGDSGRLRDPFWSLRRSFWSSREVILDSSKVIFELSRVILTT